MTAASKHYSTELSRKMGIILGENQHPKALPWDIKLQNILRTPQKRPCFKRNSKAFKMYTKLHCSPASCNWWLKRKKDGGEDKLGLTDTFIKPHAFAISEACTSLKHDHKERRIARCLWKLEQTMRWFAARCVQCNDSTSILKITSNTWRWTSSKLNRVA